MLFTFSFVETTGVLSSRIFEDLVEWRGRNTTPATMMIISDGVEELLAQLQQRIKFNLFWAYSCRPWTMSVVLTSAEWLWDSLLAGVLFLPLFYPLTYI